MDEITCKAISGLDLYFQWKILYFLLMVQVWEKKLKTNCLFWIYNTGVDFPTRASQPLCARVAVGNKCVKGA